MNMSKTRYNEPEPSPIQPVQTPSGDSSQQRQLARNREIAQVQHALRDAILQSLRDGLMVEELIHILGQEITHWSGILIADQLERR